MPRLLLVLVFLIAAPAPGDEPSALEQNSDGWIDLLAEAGPELKGWTRVPIPAPPKGTLQEENQWSIDTKTGVLTCSGKHGHEWLRYDREFSDFVYHVEWRYVPVEGKAGYNSGMYGRNSKDGTIWHQAQMGGGSGGYLFGDTEQGRELKRVNLSKEAVKDRVRPAGEWNTFELTCKGSDMLLWVNGAETCAWHDCEVPSGYVGLEAEGWAIEFRNVKVKPLK
jgi:hypothetical protein